MTGISFKVPDHELDRVNYYRATQEGGNTSIALFVRRAMRERCDGVGRIRAGGLSVKYLNPDNLTVSTEEKRKALCILKQADADLTNIHGALGRYLTELTSYFQKHFFGMDDAAREETKARFIEDLTAEARFGDTASREE